MVKSRIEGLSVQSGLLSHVEDALKKKSAFYRSSFYTDTKPGGGIERIEPATARILAFRLLSCTSSGSVIRTFWAWNFQLNTRSVSSTPKP